MWPIWPFRRRPREEISENSTVIQPEEDIGAALDLVEWGIRLGTLGKPELAARRLARAVKGNPDDPAAHYNLGLALDQMGEYSEAVRSCTRAAEIAPDSVDVRVNLGAALLASGDSRAAVKEFRTAVELAPSDPAACFGLGCAQFANRNHRKAVEAFRKAIEADSDDPQIRFNLAIALIRVGCPDLAEIELRAFLDMAGDRFPAQRAYAERALASPDTNERASGDDGP